MTERTPVGFRRTDPDETAGRLLYRSLANAEARAQMVGVTRRVRLLPNAGTSVVQEEARSDPQTAAKQSGLKSLLTPGEEA